MAEHQYSEEAQAAILKTIFLVQESCPFLLRELNDFAGYVLIKRTIEQSPCELTPLLMKVRKKSHLFLQIYNIYYYF